MDVCQATYQLSAIIFRIAMPIFLDSFSNSRFLKLPQLILFILLATVSVFGWLRMAETISVYNYLIQLGLNPHPLYFVVSGGLIGMLFLIAFITQITRSAWSRRFIHLCAAMLAAVFLIETIVLSINKTGVFSLIIEFILIIAIYLLSEKSSESLKQNEKSSISRN